MFIFDTDHLGIIQEQTRPEFDRIMRRMSGHSTTDFFLSIVSFQEQMLGWNAYLSRARSEDAIVRAYRMFQKVLADFAAFQVLAFDSSAARAFTAFRAQRIRIGTMDLRIASTATSQGMIVLTRNTVDFGQVPGIQLEDWTVV